MAFYYLVSFYFCFVASVLILRSFSDTLHIPAFDYTRTLGRIQLGQCAHTIVKYSGGPVLENCYLPLATGNVNTGRKHFSYKNVFLLESEDDVFRKIGLCDGRTASLLGILYKGDCFATDVAKKLSFSSRHVVLAYIEHYRPKLAKLHDVTTDIPEIYSHYAEDKYYLNEIGYGTKEMIIVNMQFGDKERAAAAKALPIQSKILTVNLENIAASVGTPRKIKTIRVSTADTTFQQFVFKGNSGFNEMVSVVERYQDRVERIREEIRHGVMEDPPLKYAFEPYVQEQEQSDEPVRTGPVALAMTARMDETEMWEKITLLEIQASDAINKYKRYTKFCKSNPNWCTTLSRTIRHTKKVNGGLHLDRARWFTLDNSEKSRTLRVESLLKRIKDHLKSEAKKIKRNWRNKSKQSKG